MPDFSLVADFKMTGDQPGAVERLSGGSGLSLLAVDRDAKKVVEPQTIEDFEQDPTRYLLTTVDFDEKDIDMAIPVAFLNQYLAPGQNMPVRVNVGILVSTISVATTIDINGSLLIDQMPGEYRWGLRYVLFG